MPGYNRTGPLGEGAMTGLGRGLCNTDGPAYGQGFRGRRLGRGFRGGSGLETREWPKGRLGRNRAALTGAYPEEKHGELQRLKTRAEAIQRTLDTINNRITEMEKSE